MRSVRARFFALLAAWVVLIAATAPARAHFFCHMREQVVIDCCCPTAPTHPPGERPVSARAPDCCERVSPATAAAVATTHDTKASLVAPSFLAIVFEHQPLEQSPQVVDLLRAMARAPPAIGPPAFIAYCRFLI